MMTQTTSIDPVTDWAKSVVTGEIVAGPHVRAACRRHLHDLEHGAERGLKFDVDLAMKSIRWFEKHLRLNGGRFEGKRFRLHPSQKFRLGSLFGWVWTVEDEDTGRRKGKRRFRRFYDEEAKGNGKSPFLAGIGLYCLVADGESRAEIYAAAAKKDQAYVLFRDAVAMVEQSPGLFHRIATRGENPVYQLDYKSRKGDARFFKPISADRAASGPRPHVALCDEVHEHPSRDTIDLLERGFKWREQPLLAMATNSGSDRGSICFEEHRHAVAVAHQLIEDDTTFSFVCCVDDADDWETDPECWIKSNPLLGTTMAVADLARAVEQARLIPGKRNGIARLHFCEWTQAEGTAISLEAWRGARREKPFLTDDYLRQFPCYMGLDLSQTNDFTALVMIWKISGELDSTRYYWRTRFWTPGDTLHDRASRDQVDYVDFAKRGFIEVVPGRRLRYDWLADAMGEQYDRWQPEMIGADEYGLTRLQDHLTLKGMTDLPFVIHPQGFQVRVLDRDEDEDRDGADKVTLWMEDSISRFEEALTDDPCRLEVEHNPLLDHMAASVAFAENRTGRRMFDKLKALGRIDGMVAGAMAFGVACCRDRVEENIDDFAFGVLKAR